MFEVTLERRNAAKRSFFAKLVKKVEIGPTFFVVSLFFILSIITVMTLLNATHYVTKGGELSSLESEHRELVREKEVLDRRISSVRSLNAISKSNQLARMYSSDMVVYIEGDTVIASAK